MTARSTWLLLPALCFSLLSSSALASDAKAGKIARGKYLTEEVAQCQTCHSPRRADGELDKSSWFKGGTMASKGATIQAPDITGGGEIWKRWGDKGMRRFLETAGNPAGDAPRHPMPAWKLRGEDAEDIVAYLKSLR